MSFVLRLLKRSIGLLHLSALAAILLTVTSVSAQVDQAQYDSGEKIFKANCASCHKPDKDMTGPAVKGATQRWEGKGDLHAWIKNSQAYIKTGNDHAKQLFETHNKIVMPPQAVSDADIAAILYYADNYGPPASAKPQTEAPAEKAPSSNWEWLVITGLLLLLVLLSLGGVRHQLSNAVREKQGLAAEPALGIWGRICRWAGRNKGWASVAVLLLLVWGAVLTWNFLFQIGVYGGETVAHYKPSQSLFDAAQTHQ